ncbi:MAG: NAD-binding protein, partial [Thermoplasmata archaeon]
SLQAEQGWGMYAVLGIGRLGLEIINGLDCEKKEVLIIDEDENTLAFFKKQGYKVLKVDSITPKVLEQEAMEWDRVLILGDEGNTNIKLAQSAGKILPKATIIVNAPDRESEKTLQKMEGMLTLRASENAKSALKSTLAYLEREQTAFRLRKILQKTDGNVGIFTHDNPDPDSMAAAVAFQAICANFDCSSKIYHGGEISHQENKEMVRLLDIELNRIASDEDLAIALQNAAKIVMIETVIPGENNVLPKDVVPNMIFDHHSTSKDVIASDLVDIRSDVGAISTVLTQYLQQLDVEVGSKLATALLYALRVDTKAFTRNVSPTDLKAAAFLSPFSDEDLLARIESPPMTSDTMDVIGRAIVNREVRDNVMFSAVGYVEERDALPQAAEFLMREKGVKVVGLCGIRGYNIHISARSSDPGVHIGEAMKTTFGELGSGGGHATSGGVQIPLERVNVPDKSDKELIANIVANMIRKMFFAGLGVDISAKTI